MKMRVLSLPHWLFLLYFLKGILTGLKTILMNRLNYTHAPTTKQNYQRQNEELKSGEYKKYYIMFSFHQVCYH